MPISPTPEELLAQIAANILDNTSELITPVALRGVLNAIVNSFQDLQDSDNINQGAANLFMTAAERTKLEGIQAGAQNVPGFNGLDPLSLTDTTQKKLSPAQMLQILAIWVPIYWPTLASQAEAEAGTSTAPRNWTPQRIKQAIEALAPAGGGGSQKHVWTAYNYIGETNTVRYFGIREAFDSSTLQAYGLVVCPFDGAGSRIVLRTSAAGTFRIRIFKDDTSTHSFETADIVTTAMTPATVDISSFTFTRGQYIGFGIVIGSDAPILTALTVEISNTE